MTRETQLLFRDLITNSIYHNLDSHEYDLSRIIKEALYSLGKDEYSLNNQVLKDALHDLRKIRNFYSHLSEQPTLEKELSNILRMKEIASLLLDTSRRECTAIKQKLFSILENDEKTIANKLYSNPISKSDQYVIKDEYYEHLISSIQILDSIYDKLYDMPSRLKSGRYDEKRLANIEEKEEMFESIRAVVDGTYPNSTIAGTLQFYESEIDSWIYECSQSILGLPTVSERTQVSIVKNQINNGIAEEKARSELFALREVILKETNIERSKCILRKTVLESFLKFKVDDLEKYNIYISDMIIFDKSEQEQYLEKIFSIIKSIEQ